MRLSFMRVLLLVGLAGAALLSPAAAAAQQGPAILPTDNWAGYVATDAYYTGVGALVRTPTPAALRGIGVTTSWVGIGGVATGDLIQAGVAVSQRGTGVTYEAWYETLPQPARRVALPIGPGDWVRLDIREVAPGGWQVTIVDGTRVFQRRVAYASSHASAEWIVEAPALANGAIVPLAPVAGADFAAMGAIANGRRAVPSQLSPQAVALVGPGGALAALPGPLGPDGTSFRVITS